MITRKVTLVDQKYLVDQGWPKQEGASDCWSKKFAQWFVVIYDQRARYHLPNLTPFNMRRALQNIANSSHKLLPYFYRHLPVLALQLNPPFAPIDCIIIHPTFAPFKEQIQVIHSPRNIAMSIWLLNPKHSVFPSWAFFSSIHNWYSLHVLSIGNTME